MHTSISIAQQSALERSRHREHRQAQYRRESATRQEQAKTWRRYLERGAYHDYRTWLNAHLEAGGQITHAYDYPLVNVWIARHSFTITPLYGAPSYEFDMIIVPSGIGVSGDAGHINVVQWASVGKSLDYVPCYNNL